MDEEDEYSIQSATAPGAAAALLEQSEGPSISPMMSAINRESLIRARTIISNKFNDPADLDDLGMYTTQIKKQMALSESQLNGAVQGKLEALKRAVDLMDESAVKLAGFAESMKRVDDRVAVSNTVISNFEYLRRVHFARDNIQKVLTQIEFFARVPDRVMELHALLESDPSRLKDVFLEAIKLESLRIALINEIGTGSRGRRGPMDGNTQMIQAAVDEHLHIVPELVMEVKRRLYANMDQLFDLAADSPADVVMTFEIIEMYQEYLDRRAQQFRKKMSNARDGDPDITASFGYENISGDAQEKLQQKLATKVETTFTSALASKNKPPTAEAGAVLEDTPTTLTMQAATQILAMISVFATDVAPCIPPNYGSLLMFIEVYEAQLIPRVRALIDNLSQIEVSDIMSIVDWIEYFNMQMENFGFNHRPCCEMFTRMSEDLINEYLDRIRNQISKWFVNIKQQQLEIMKAADNSLISTHPEDMFNVIHVQVQVAKEKLPAEHLKDVVNACLQVLREVQRDGYDSLSANWKSMGPETLCALINDNQRMQEKCEEFADRVIQLIPQDDHREMLTAMLDEVSNEYVSLAMNAIGFLARAILEDLEEPVFSRLFTLEWETGFGESFCSILAATLQDYFQDLQVWLIDYFYCKLVREMLGRVTGLYMMSLRRMNAPTHFHFNSEIMAARKIIIDVETLRDFFESHGETLFKAGLRPNKNNKGVGGGDGRTPVEEELEPIEFFARVVSATHITGVEREVRQLYDRYGADGLKLVQSAINCNPSLSRPERLDCIEKAVKMFERGGGGNKKYSSTLSEIYKGVGDDATESAATTANKKQQQPQNKQKSSWWFRSKS